MTFENLVNESKKYFPNLEIKYKDQSNFMKFIGFLLFFNKDFMTKYITTIGNTVYFPSRDYIVQYPVRSSITLLHEFIHINDARKIGTVLFNFLYLFPQILIIFCLPLLLVSWKLALVLLILCALPLPAYFRMKFERKAYISSLYVYKKLGDRLNKTINYNEHKDFSISQFKTSVYYFMWMFNSIDKDFDDAILKINNGEKPYEDDILDVVVDLSKNI